METILETTNLILREFSRTDLENLLQLDTGPIVMKYISDGKPATIEETRAVLERLVGPNSGRCGLWACELRATHEFLGWFHLRPFKENPEEIELGYRLVRSGWGKGFATEMSRALLHRAFVEWKVEKVVAATMAENQGSRRVMEKLGMSFEKGFIESNFLPLSTTG